MSSHGPARRFGLPTTRAEQARIRSERTHARDTRVSIPIVTVKPLDPAALFTATSVDQLPFDSTETLEPLEGFPGQERASEAICFGIGMRHEGYNLFAVGPPGSGRHSLVRTFLERATTRATSEFDWCYVYNFDQPHRPRAIRLQAGQARDFRADMHQLTEDLWGTIVAAFETEEYRARQAELERDFSARQEEELEEVRTRASEKGLAIIRTPAGVAVAPMKDGKVVDLDTLKKLPQEEQAQIRESIAALEAELAQLFQQVPLWRRESNRKLKALKDTLTRSAVQALVDELLQKYAEIDSVVAYLNATQADVIKNASSFSRATRSRTRSQPGADVMLSTSSPVTVRIVEHR